MNNLLVHCSFPIISLSKNFLELHCLGDADDGVLSLALMLLFLLREYLVSFLCCYPLVLKVITPFE